MKCYRCKKKDLKSAVRVFMPPKDAREKGKYRDICDDCYHIIMTEKGYTLIDGIWRTAPSPSRKDEK